MDSRGFKVVVLYRMAEKQNKNTDKVKPDWVNNFSCLQSLVKGADGAEVIVFGDRLNIDTVETITEWPITYIQTTAHGNAETFLEILQYAIDNYSPDDIIYFVEDDYIHRPGFIEVLKEGLQRADYVSLYDHPDKYGQPVRLFHTKSSHWQFVESTTMTFAARVKTLAFDAKVFREAVSTGNPPDHVIFSYLTQQMQRRLATPIPGYATHGEEKWLAPVIDWSKYAEYK